MRQVSVVIVMLIVLSCSNKSKKEDIVQIENFKKEISKQKEQILKQQKTIESIEKAHDNSLGKIKTDTQKLEREKDSIKRLYEISIAINGMSDNVTKNYTKTLDYKIVTNDKYWNRGVYYTSEKKNEYFFNVKTSIINNQMRFYFMGVEYPLKKDNLIINVYELNDNKELYEIDTVNLSSVASNLVSDYDAETFFHELTSLQLDNLILKNGRLYYYKIKEIKTDYRPKVVKKEYYEYVLGSKNKTQKIETTVLSNVIVETPDDIKIISPDKTKVVINYGEVMSFHEITNWNKQCKLILSNEYIVDKLPELKFKLSDHIKESKEFGLAVDEDTGEALLFGGICWHSRKNILYFDNSGMTFRCIWEIDFDKNKVTKIVPEHEAIHPYFFETLDKEYITYVEKNKIMLCEPESNFN
ncbi:hypothetical protein [Tenacibaculum agarivorans]|uniref:hypothetical protein n=1 Tax=Tenacibaculum agarivorans TaxID=1908389 RepID=UPI00094B916E|nr:hypothetical protein [Tenacibaculum agarivorans]